MDILWRIIIAGVVFLVLIFAYNQYSEPLLQRFFAQSDEYTIYVNRVAFSVSVAADRESRRQGLSGVTGLPEYGGKLFIFDTPGKHGIWMKDMLFPIDVLWFDEQFTLIHIEQNMTPESYPAVFAPPQDARFVLEVNAYTAEALNLTVGNSLTLPVGLIPADLRNTSQVN